MYVHEIRFYLHHKIAELQIPTGINYFFTYVEFFTPPTSRLHPSPSAHGPPMHGESEEMTGACFVGSFGLETLKIPPF